MEMYRNQPGEHRLIRVDWVMTPCDGYSRSTTTRELLSADLGTSHKAEELPEEEEDGLMDAPLDLIFSIKRTMLVRRKREEVYLSWLFAQALPMFLHGVRTDQGHEASFLTSEVHVASERDGELIGWHSLPGSEFTHSGWVRFEEAMEGEATVLWIQLESTTPPGLNPREFYKELEQQVDHDLAVLKRRLEEPGRPAFGSNDLTGEGWSDAA